jgi:GT2 family glycosyltransferase
MAQDAVPASDLWLTSLVEPFERDPCVAGTWARQRPRPDASPIARHYLERWLAASPSARVCAVASAAELEGLPPMARVERCAFDNVCACVRRTVWEQHPFRATAIGEDIAWAREVLLAGFRLAYVPAAEVIHSHDRSAAYELARTYVLHRRLFELFQLRTIPSLRALARAVASTMALHLRCERTRPSGERQYGRALGLALAWPIGQYIGALSAARGWPAWRTRNV